MIDGQTFPFIPNIGNHIWLRRRHFISHIGKSRMTDGHTSHFIPHIGNHVWLRRTDISFHPSYWKPRMTETEIFHFSCWKSRMTETDRHFISFFILKTTNVRRTDISFHSSYWKPRLTETDRHFISFLILETTYDWDLQTFHFISHIGNHVWLRRTDSISFHSSYWKPRMTDGYFISFLILETTYDWDGETFHFIPHIGNHVWQTDRHFNSFLILETTYDRRNRHFISFLIL